MPALAILNRPLIAGSEARRVALRTLARTGIGATNVHPLQSALRENQPGVRRCEFLANRPLKLLLLLGPAAQIQGYTIRGCLPLRAADSPFVMKLLIGRRYVATVHVVQVEVKALKV